MDVVWDVAKLDSGALETTAKGSRMLSGPRLK